MAKNKPAEKKTDLNRLRLDKWLWAARFYKTRSVAKHAIEGGKVYCEGSRCKPGKEVEIGMEIRLSQGLDEKTVIIQALSGQRRGAPEAQLLYAETEESIEQREKQALERKAQPSLWQSDGKPNKRDRRLIHRFKQS
ncbi:MAG: S4 domain-containing protein [Gammaproteobacteria bacterium]|nr:S4 domain-containing protein [Gammaproteobacteria bacterium]MDG2337580.1 S4 domain-containing protein [Gammaproteobacteria bacterium]